jgi:hypothetical protein
MRRLALNDLRESRHQQVMWREIVWSIVHVSFPAVPDPPVLFVSIVPPMTAVTQNVGLALQHYGDQRWPLRR